MGLGIRLGTGSGQVDKKFFFSDMRPIQKLECSRKLCSDNSGCFSIYLVSKCAGISPSVQYVSSCNRWEWCSMFIV